MLIDEIIDLLSDEKSSLSGALLKTSVLLHRIGKKDLAEWVKDELEGYPDEVELPSYRILSAQLLGNVSNIALSYSSHPLPTMHLSKNIQDNLASASFRQPLNTIEALANSDNVTRLLPPEYYSMLSKGFANNLQVTTAWCSTQGSALKGMLMQIRAKLLNFLLSLRDTIGDDVGESEMKKKVENIDTKTMFQSAIFGPNTTIIVGDKNQNTQTINNVVQNNFESLSKKLKEIGIPKKEIDTLETLINEDIQKHGKASIEGKTGNWLNRMLAGAKNGTLGVTVEAVTSGVTRALLEYVG